MVWAKECGGEGVVTYPSSMDWNLEVVMADDVGFGGFKLTFGDRGPGSSEAEGVGDLLRLVMYGTACGAENKQRK